MVRDKNQLVAVPSTSRTGGIGIQIKKQATATVTSSHQAVELPEATKWVEKGRWNKFFVSALAISLSL